ncbi:MAG: hypothetical protein NVV57_03745 [Demequina sp.]|nr:hypothetical protein [Demequina sp.]
MIQLSEPLGWAVLGVLLATVLSSFGLVVGMIPRQVRAGLAGLQVDMAALKGDLLGVKGEVAGLNHRFDGIADQLAGHDHRFEGIAGQLAGHSSRFDAMQAQIDALRMVVDRRLDGLDRDVAALTREVMGGEAGRSE